MDPMNRVILDTDLGSDVSDLAAVFLFLKCAQKGLLHPQGLLMNTGNEQGVQCLHIAYRYTGQGALNIGAPEPGFLNFAMHWKYTKFIIQKYPQWAAECKPAPYVPHFRKCLAGAPDHSVTLVCNGPLRGLAMLLRSERDPISPLNGRDLVAQKVRKLIVASGHFKAENQPAYPRRSGWDVWSYTASSMYIDWDIASARFVDDEWPTRMDWIGCESAYSHLVGHEFYQKSPEDHPLHLACKYFTKGSGHISGNPLAVLCAVPALSGNVLYSEPGRVLMNDEGRTVFNAYQGGRDRRVLPETPDEVYRQIDTILLE